MSQFPGSYPESYMDASTTPRKTSGLAITALVFSLIGIIPCCGVLTAPVGALLGIIGLVMIGSDPARKGKGLAAFATIIGIVLAAVQVWAISWIVNTFVIPVWKGPEAAFAAGFAGDISGFKTGFYGPGASTGDAEAQAFLDQLRARYGEYVSCRFAGNQRQNTQFGQTQEQFFYELEFRNKTVRAEAEMIFADQQTGKFVMKLGYVTIFDPDLGDLTYPASEENKPPGEDQGDAAPTPNGG